MEQPTDWCAGMVVVPKPSGTVRICVDLTKLNNAVNRERYILPSVEHSLGQLKGAKVFLKLKRRQFRVLTDPSVTEFCPSHNLY